MKHKPYLSLFIALLVMIPALSFAQMGPKANMKMNQLDLTKEQQTQVNAERMTFQKKMIQLQADVKVAEIDYFQALKSGASDKDVTNKLDALTSAKNKLASARNDHLLAVRKIIGNDKFAQFHGHFMGGMQHKGEFGRCDKHFGPGHMQGERPMRPMHPMRFQQDDDD